MMDKHLQNFDLSILLRSKDLDARGIAENKPSLSIGEYFESLSQFVALAPVVKDALARIANFGGDENAFRNLADINILLPDIGCNKFVPVIHEILEAGEKGKPTFAAAHAQEILHDFDKLCALTASAKKTQTSDLTADASDENYAANRAASLKSVLKQLEREEAARKLRILAVDDTPVMLKTIIAGLGDNYRVYGLSNPMMIEKVLRNFTPELFLLDYNMPGRSGFDLVPIIRSFDEHKDTPIIFVTSMRTFDHLSGAVALGACDFVVKPIQPDILREKVAKHIVRKKLL